MRFYIISCHISPHAAGIRYFVQGSTLRPESGLFQVFFADGSESGLASPVCLDFFTRKTASLPEWTLDKKNG